MPYVNSRLGEESDPAVPAKNLPSAASENEPRQFPSFHRVKPLEPFRERWKAKRLDYDRFVALVEEVNRTKLRTLNARLPDGLVDDWQASWVRDIFRGNLPGHDGLTPEQIASAFEDVEALVKAFQFVEYPGRFNNTYRFWLYELSDNPGMGLFPRLDQVVSHLPDLNPRRGMEYLAGDASNSRRFDQEQFFETAAFMLGTPTDLEWDWLHRLAYRPDSLDSIWNDPPSHHIWARNQLVRVIPALGGCLDKYPPELDDSTLSITEVVRRTDKWICKVARPELLRRNWIPTHWAEEGRLKGTPEPTQTANSAERSGNVPSVQNTAPSPPTVPAETPSAKLDAPAGEAKSRGGRKKLANLKTPTDKAKHNVYELIRIQRKAKPNSGPKKLSEHFKDNNDFRLRLKEAGLKFGANIFRAALNWIKSNSDASQETQ